MNICKRRVEKIEKKRSGRSLYSSVATFASFAFLFLIAFISFTNPAFVSSLCLWSLICVMAFDRLTFSVFVFILFIVDIGRVSPTLFSVYEGKGE